MRTVFYHYLRDTLVAENITQAKRIAFGEFRNSDDCPQSFTVETQTFWLFL